MLVQAVQAGRREFIEIVLIGVALFFVIVAVFWATDTSVLQSDEAGYSAQSYEWWRANVHLPGYAVLLWILRQGTLGIIGDAALLQVISLAAWCGSLYIFLQIAAIVNPGASRLGAVLYGLFPFVGITYVAWPRVDSVAHLALVYGVLCLFRQDWPRLMLALAVMLLMQKALWPFALTISLVAWWRGFPLWRILAAGAPLAIFWLAVAAGGAGLLWIIAVDLKVNLPSQSSLPILDGVFGTLTQGDMRGIIKGLLLLGLLIGTGVMTWTYGRRSNLEMLAILVPVLGLLVVLNQFEAWASVRYAKILVIPLIGLPISQQLGRKLAQARAIFWLVVMVLAATQVAFAIRIADYFTSSDVSEITIPAVPGGTDREPRGGRDTGSAVPAQTSRS
jgi:hypothetical protein